MAGGVWLGGQTRPASVGMLDEHPAIQYASRPTTDRVATLSEALAAGTRSLARDDRTGYLPATLEALDVPRESQLVFSKTGVQRDYTSSRHPRALYFNESVVVGYIPGRPRSSWPRRIRSRASCSTRWTRRPRNGRPLRAGRAAWRATSRAGRSKYRA